MSEDEKLNVILKDSIYMGGGNSMSKRGCFSDAVAYALVGVALAFALVCGWARASESVRNAPSNELGAQFRDLLSEVFAGNERVNQSVVDGVGRTEALSDFASASRRVADGAEVSFGWVRLFGLIDPAHLIPLFFSTREEAVAGLVGQADSSPQTVKVLTPRAVEKPLSNSAHGLDSDAQFLRRFVVDSAPRNEVVGSASEVAEIFVDAFGCDHTPSLLASLGGEHLPVLAGYVPVSAPLEVLVHGACEGPRHGDGVARVAVGLSSRNEVVKNSGINLDLHDLVVGLWRADDWRLRPAMPDTLADDVECGHPYLHCPGFGRGLRVTSARRGCRHLDIATSERLPVRTDIDAAHAVAVDAVLDGVVVDAVTAADESDGGGFERCLESEFSRAQRIDIATVVYRDACISVRIRPRADIITDREFAGVPGDGLRGGEIHSWSPFSLGFGRALRFTRLAGAPSPLQGLDKFSQILVGVLDFVVLRFPKIPAMDAVEKNALLVDVWAGRGAGDPVSGGLQFVVHRPHYGAQLGSADVPLCVCGHGLVSVARGPVDLVSSVRAIPADRLRGFDLLREADAPLCAVDLAPKINHVRVVVTLRTEGFFGLDAVLDSHCPVLAGAGLDGFEGGIRGRHGRLLVFGFSFTSQNQYTTDLIGRKSKIKIDSKTSEGLRQLPYPSTLCVFHKIQREPQRHRFSSKNYRACRSARRGSWGDQSRDAARHETLSFLPSKNPP